MERHNFRHNKLPSFETLIVWGGRMETFNFYRRRVCLKILNCLAIYFNSIGATLLS